MLRHLWGGCRTFERDGSNLLGLHAKGGGGGGPALGSMLKRLHRGQNPRPRLSYILKNEKRLKLKRETYETYG